MEIDSIFRVYDFVERVDVSGGEALLHPNIEQIVDHVANFERQFGSMRIISNGTILPKTGLLSLMQQNGKKYSFLLDDYGHLSPKMGRTQELLEEYSIPYKVNVYHGDNQYCGGWIDFGNFLCRGYSDEQVSRVFQNCHTSQNPCITIFEGDAYFCVRSMTGYKFGHYEISAAERMDLRDIYRSLSENRQKAIDFGKYPPVGCKYCNGFDTQNSERFPAAEQL
ncbi:MAG: hypothetical protein VB065_12830 [Eubacteriales bacterium]|nr:hypothetical protein [Christensenellaceae bacterium]MEA5066922.1 hypothetical protein [Eubacteriales bacterium]